MEIKVFYNFLCVSEWLNEYIIVDKLSLSWSNYVFKKRGVWAIFDLTFNNHTNSFIKQKYFESTWLYKLKLCCLFFDTLNDKHDSYITQGMNTLNYIHSQNTCNRFSITILHFNRSASQRSLTQRAVREWNSLALHIRITITIKSIRPKLKAHYCFTY